MLTHDEKLKAIDWAEAEFRKMLVGGSEGRRGALWRLPRVLSPRREVTSVLGRKLLMRHARRLGRRVMRYVCKEQVDSGSKAGTYLEEYSKWLYKMLGVVPDKKMNEVPRELLIFAGCFVVMTRSKCWRMRVA